MKYSNTTVTYHTQYGSHLLLILQSSYHFCVHGMFSNIDQYSHPITSSHYLLICSTKNNHSNKWRNDKPLYQTQQYNEATQLYLFKPQKLGHLTNKEALQWSQKFREHIQHIEQSGNDFRKEIWIKKLTIQSTSEISLGYIYMVWLYV